MKIMKYILVSCFALLSMTACDNLNLAPEDYYASGNYWKTAAQVESAITGLHLNLRGTYTSFFYMGELRGGTHRSGTSMVATSLGSANIVTNELTEDTPGLTNWNGLYSPIFQVNHVIDQLENGCSFLSESSRSYYLGQAYGLRAMYYFLLYRTWGGVPMIKESLILKGSNSASALYTARSTPEEIMTFIKEDIKNSEDNFTTGSSQSKIKWNPDATQMLKAQVYLWSGKVATGDHAAGGVSDLQIAKTALQNVIGKYSLVDDYSSVFSAKNKNNGEIIFALRFLEGEFTGSGLIPLFISEATYFNNKFYSKEGQLMGDTLDVNTGGGLLRYQYKWGLFASMNQDDKRGAATFLDCYKKDDSENLLPAGLICRKMLGSINSSNNRIYDCDWIVYRYADALLMMAEIENGLGGDVAGYINQVRARAFGFNGDRSAFAAAYPAEVYTSGSFADNELAILHERDKEFVLESSRWFDVVRLRGADGNSICFSPASGYIDVEGGTATSVLKLATQEHMLLWPVNVSLMNDDPLVEQTPGYEKKEEE